MYKCNMGMPDTFLGKTMVLYLLELELQSGQLSLGINCGVFQEQQKLLTTDPFASSPKAVYCM